MNELAFAVGLAPTIALAFFIYQKDRFDREPAYLLIKLFLYGALVVIPVYFVEKFIASINIFRGVLSIAYMAFIVAGLTEEFFKRLVVCRIACMDKHYDEKLDGIIYSVFAALGFATIENLMYIFIGSQNHIYIGVTRGLFAVPAHTLFGITMGYYLSLSKFAETERESQMYYRKSLYVPVILHGIYDFVLMLKLNGLMIVFIPFVLYLWKTNLSKLNSYVKEARIRNDENEKKL